MEDKRYAVLIDADNISSKYISSILDEMTKYGVVTYKRIYGDWTTPQAGKWKHELMENSITPIQQFRNTVGKNATDSTLIIDAMDILYTKNVDGFCIVSSDGDFTRLASRLKESGMDVIGMGENKTPRSFRAACSVFTDLELLQDLSEDESDIQPQKKNAKPKNILSQQIIENAIIEIVMENDNKGRQTGLGEIGSRLQKKYSDFDVRNYGYNSLSTFIEEIESFDLKKVNNTAIVGLRGNDNLKEKVIAFAIENVKKSGGRGLELGALGQKIHTVYPNFNVKEYGYSTLSKFIAGIKQLTIENISENRKMVYLRV
jgi:uncharacterized protein (TIGR00288 family)